MAERLTHGAEMAPRLMNGAEMAPRFMNGAEIAAFVPADPPGPGADRFARLRDGLKRSGNYSPRQIAGRAFPIACVALEITQRCNLDCSLCYLSDRAEMAHDLPLGEIFRRIDLIHDHYGPATNVQITGGDPTLRSVEDLCAIVAYLKSRGLRSALFTNGIRASRDMLTALAGAGLNDVALHVDLTQERKGYATEAELNAVRREYIARARGLGLRILFNTTVFDGNFREIPALTRFFLEHAANVHLASFQMQADTGRGTLRSRDEDLITQQSMIDRIEQGAGTGLDFDGLDVGHPRCNRYASVVTAGGDVVSLHSDRTFLEALFAAAARDGRDWNRTGDVVRAAIANFLRSPRLTVLGLTWLLATAWKLRRGLFRARGRVHRLRFFIHNFMDARQLERERCEGCVFMTMTASGPLSMCVHNARRDAHIFAPAPVATPDGVKFWDPATGKITAEANVAPPEPDTQPFKKLKGRLRAEAMQARNQAETR